MNSVFPVLLEQLKARGTQGVFIILGSSGRSMSKTDASQFGHGVSRYRRYSTVARGLKKLALVRRDDAQALQRPPHSTKAR